MALRTYGDAAAPAEERSAMKLATLIVSKEMREFTSRDVQREKQVGLRSKAETDPALMVLVQAGWLRSQTEKTGGRPRHVYHVNPAIHGEGGQ
jgi:predicted transcriptional regulator